MSQRESEGARGIRGLRIGAAMTPKKKGISPKQDNKGREKKRTGQMMRLPRLGRSRHVKISQVSELGNPQFQPFQPLEDGQMRESPENLGSLELPDCGLTCWAQGKRVVRLFLSLVPHLTAKYKTHILVFFFLYKYTFLKSPWRHSSS